MSAVLVVGIGGLGSPASIALASAGVGRLGIADDDVVDASNLHRQILFGDEDVGIDKVTAAARALERWLVPGTSLESHRTRLLPDNAREIVRRYDVVLEGSDNFATKFMMADACMLERVPIVHAAAVRWRGTVLAVGPAGAPCYRCLFEDVPHEHAEGCAEAGVMGPVTGIVAALQVDMALGALRGERVFGELATFDGKTLELRRRVVPRRRGCPLCDLRSIQRLDFSAYVPPDCSLPTS